MTENSDTSVWSHPFRVGDLPNKRATTFEIVPDATARRAVADHLTLLDVRKLRFSGTLKPLGKTGWQLEARLGATVVQSCVVTTEPVTTRIEEPVARSFVTDLPDPDAGSEFEIPEDDTVEQLGAIIDPGEIMAEVLALALPPYPRIAGADTGEAVFTEPGKAPMKDEDARPFAGLKALRDGLKKDDG